MLAVKNFYQYFKCYEGIVKLSIHLYKKVLILTKSCYIILIPSKDSYAIRQIVEIVLLYNNHF